MLRTMTLALAMAALIAGPVEAQDQASAPVEATAPAATAPASGPAKHSLAEKMAIAAGLFGAGFAAYKMLKPGKSATPAASAPTAQAGAQ